MNALSFDGRRTKFGVSFQTSLDWTIILSNGQIKLKQTTWSFNEKVFKLSKLILVIFKDTLVVFFGVVTKGTHL